MIALPRLTGRIFGTPLAIERGKLDAIVAAVGPRLKGVPLAGWEEEGNSPVRGAYQVTSAGIAVIPIQGTLVSKSSGMDAMSGLTSYADIAADFAAAQTDGRVRGILLDVDSPGGEVQGMFDLADQMYAARGQKPVCAFASCACSAAYLLASTADWIVSPRDGMVGSVGIIALHLDESGADAQAGLKYTAVYAGERKNDGNPHEPLTPGARAWLQGAVDGRYAMFADMVARDRKMKPAAVIQMQSAVYSMGQSGMDAGLADQVGTQADALAWFGAEIQARQKKQFAAKKGARMPGTEEQIPAEAKVPTAAEIETMVAQARDAGFGEAQQIADLCAIAGSPARAVEFIAARKSRADVTTELLKARVEKQLASQGGKEIQPGVMPGTDAKPAETKPGTAKPWRDVLKGMRMLKREGN